MIDEYVVMGQNALARTLIAAFLIVLLLISICQVDIVWADGGWLRPPYDGNYRLTAFFDHHFPNYGNDGQITIYTGESVADCSPHCYTGHPGYDWSMTTGTPILASARGVVRVRIDSTTGYGRRLIIDHENGYYTLYAHLNSFNVTINQRVASGDLIAWSGSSGTSQPHFHFGTYHGLAITDFEQFATDPFGWRGAYADPLSTQPAPGYRHTATCLWRSFALDPISCADTLIEDAGEGSTILGSWQVSNRGNGYHAYYRTNTADGGTQAIWTNNRIRPGTYRLYAFVPEQPINVSTPKTRQAQYSILTITGWRSYAIDQENTPQNTWTYFDTLNLNPQNVQITLSAFTGEATGTRLVLVDTIKLRSYLHHLPIILR